MGIFDFFKSFLIKSGITKSGTIKEYYPGGEIKRKINYKNGVSDGLTTEYFAYIRGWRKIKKKINYKNGLRDGLTTEYFAYGIRKIKKETNYKNGKKNGISKEYNESGGLHYEVNFKNGKKEGEDSRGVIYKNGVPNFKNLTRRNKNEKKRVAEKFDYELEPGKKLDEKDYLIRLQDTIQRREEYRYKNFIERGFAKSEAMSWSETGKNLTKKQRQSLLEHLNKQYRGYKDDLIDKDIEMKKKELLFLTQMMNAFKNLKGIDFTKVSTDIDNSSPDKLFTSNIDGKWYYTVMNFAMIFKAFSKKKFQKGLDEILKINNIQKDNFKEKEGYKAWVGNGFQVEHSKINETDMIIITNENMVPLNADKLQTTKLSSQVKLPTGYKNILNGIDNLYEGEKFLKANNGSLSFNIPLLFKDPVDNLNYILIGVHSLSIAKKIIDNIIEKNYGKSNFKKLDDNDEWNYIYANKFYSIGFMNKNSCIRINMIHKLKKI